MDQSSQGSVPLLAMQATAKAMAEMMIITAPMPKTVHAERLPRIMLLLLLERLVLLGAFRPTLDRIYGVQAIGRMPMHLSRYWRL